MVRELADKIEQILANRAGLEFRRRGGMSRYHKKPVVNPPNPRTAAERTPPKHGDIVVVHIPARIERRRFCGHCTIWTWEVGLTGSNVWRHRSRHLRTKKCLEAAK